MREVEFGERIFATPAFAKGTVYVRTQDALYAFEPWRSVAPDGFLLEEEGRGARPLHRRAVEGDQAPAASDQPFFRRLLRRPGAASGDEEEGSDESESESHVRETNRPGRAPREARLSEAPLRGALRRIEPCTSSRSTWAAWPRLRT